MSNNKQSTTNNKPHGFCETPEEKCTMNYCDENGCINRKRNPVGDGDPIDMSNNKQYRVEIGEERWDYDSQIPTREVISYWVMLGREKIKTFAYYQQALDYANKLNNAINSVKL